MLNLSFRRLRARFTLLAVVALSALLLRSVAFAQTSVSNGSISGTVTDTTGAVVPNAKVTITGPTGQTVRANTSDAGTYSSGALIPGCPPQKNRIPRFWPKPEGICGMQLGRCSNCARQSPPTILIGSSFITATVSILRRSIRRSPTCGSECWKHLTGAQSKFAL
jgi:hypothetical protein